MKSILTQTYSNFELLILDDASTDDTLKYINSLDDNRLRIHTEEANKGIVYQLNKGLSLARGKYIARMDADDISLPDRFKKQIDFLELNRHIDVLGCQAEKIGDSQGQLCFPLSAGSIDYLLNFYCSILHPSVMMRRSIFAELSHRYEDVPYAEDYQLWTKISNGRNFANLDEVFIKYRIHSEQLTKIKRNEQSRGAFIARSNKLKKTFRFCSDQFKDKVNTLANEYIFYGKSISSFNYRISRFEKLFFDILLLYNRKKSRPIVDFVKNNL